MRKVLCLTMNSSWTHWTPQNKHLKKSLSSSKLANKQKLRSTLLVRWACTVRETSVFGCVNGVSYANAGGKKENLSVGYIHVSLVRRPPTTEVKDWNPGIEHLITRGKSSSALWRKSSVGPLRSKHYSLLSVSAVQPFYISICIWRLPTQHTTFISLLVM